jgi:hypothetical protein
LEICPVDELEALARAAGLSRAWAQNPAEIEQAVARAARMRAELNPPSDPAAEPAPAFRAPFRAVGEQP